ncbi:MAG: Scr1 family TA system antitoxin-like transcriptional regulator [Pseudonocardiaceae bacterium]
MLRDHCGADEVTLATLAELRQEATKRGWWSTYGLARVARWLRRLGVRRQLAALCRAGADTRLAAPDPLTVSAVVSEAALQRCVRDSEIAATQIEHLLDRAALPNVELRVLPFGLGLHVGMCPDFLGKPRP